MAAAPRAERRRRGGAADGADDRLAIEGLRGAAIVARLLPPRAVFAIAAIANALLVLEAGILVAPDTATYVEWANVILDGGFSADAYRAAQAIGMRPFYLGFVTLVALLKLLLGANWTMGLVILNVVAAGLTAAMISDIVVLATMSRVAQATAILFYLACYDLANYTRFALKDAIYVCLSFAVFYFVARPILLGSRRPLREWGAALAAFLVCLSWRPSAVTLLAIPAAAAVAWRFDGTSPRAVAARRAAVYALVASIVAVILVHASVMRTPDAWPGWLPSHDWIGALSEDYQAGLVMELRASRPEPGTSLGGYLGITLYKLGLFLAFAHPDFSVGHNLAGIVFYMPLYALAILGLRGVSPRHFRQARGVRTMAWTAALFVVAVSLFHALTLLDYDWRYRLPLLPPLIVLASIGMFCLRVRR